MTRKIPFWQPAMAYAQIWRTLLGLALVVAIFVATTMGIFVSGTWLLGASTAQIVDSSEPEHAALFFLTFVGFHIGLFVVVRLLHRRGYMSLMGPQNRLIMRHFRLGVLAILGVMGLMMLSMVLEQFLLPEHARPEITLGTIRRWLIWVLPALGLIFIQIMAEELLFRGYLLQQLRARFRSVWIWAVLPSLLFGALHFDYVGYGNNAYLYVLNTTIIGVIACLVTLRTGNLAAAAGLHFGNNAFILIMGVKGDIDGFSLMAMSVDKTGGYMAYSILLQTGLSVLAFLIWWRWMNRNQPIANPVDAN